MEMKSPPPCPTTVTVRRNPPRKARATPSTAIPLRTPLSSSSSFSIPQKDIPSFPLQDLLSIEVPQNPNSDLPNSEPSKISNPVSENLKVFLRIRPLNPHQSSIKHGKAGAQACKSRTKTAWPQNPNTKKSSKANVKKKSEICVTVNDSHSVTLCPPQALQDTKRIKSEVYEGFTDVFNSDSSQDEVFGKMVNPLVEDFIRGKSGMFAALGPSGSGKTHTVFGCPREPGMVPLTLHKIFSGCEGNRAQLSRSFYLSMFEIYTEGKAERMFDLLQDGGDLCMQQATIKGLQEVIVSDVQDAESLIARGILKRATAMTNSNNQSSRSQCIINIRSASAPKKVDGEVDIQSNSAVLTIVDLAGAEREKRTGNQGARLRESNFINNTSMVFGLCLRSLLEHQKNPKKKSLEKHFQNSLLTRYLRDYLEGKKRMTLILTVKPGEEDYLDTSCLLRQASPYMKIKFNNVEEAFNSLHNKRQIQTSRTEQLKRMKFSSLEASTIDEGKGSGDESQLHKEEVIAEHVKEVKPLNVSGIFPEATTLEAENGVLLEEGRIELANTERQNQIMQGFAKALWNALKQYKHKLLEAENKILRLTESLSNEKSHCSELENELKNLKSCCSCGMQTSAELSIGEVDEPIDVQEIKAGVSSIILKESGRIDNEQESSATVRSPCAGFLSCIDLENSDEQNYQVRSEIDKSFRHCTHPKHESFGENVDNAEERKDTEEDMGRVANHFSGVATEHSESLANSSESHVILREDSCSFVDRYQLQNEEPVKKAAGFSLILKETDCINNENKSIATVRSPCEVENSEEQSYQDRSEIYNSLRHCTHDKDESIGANVENTEDIKDPEDKGRKDNHLSGVATDSGLSESVVSSSQSSSTSGDESNPSVEDYSRNDGDKKWLDKPPVPEDHSDLSVGCDTSNASQKRNLTRGCVVSKMQETELKVISCSNPLNAEKPKRRLLPASSLLLKDKGGLGFEEENEKLKENRGGKKLVADESKRTQGSITLLRLLTSNPNFR